MVSRLVVLEGNPKYYGRLGFEPSAPQGITITLPSWAPPEAAQLMRLGSYDPAIRGHVIYPPAFDGVIEHGMLAPGLGLVRPPRAPATGGAGAFGWLDRTVATSSPRS